MHEPSDNEIVKELLLVVDLCPDKKDYLHFVHDMIMGKCRDWDLSFKVCNQRLATSLS